MKISIFLVVILAVAAASATLQKRSTAHSSTLIINNFVDRTVELLQSFLVTNELDSVSLPNVTQTFSYTPVWITYTGYISLYNGVLSNLSSVKRFGDVIISYDTGVLALDFDMGVDELTYNFDFDAKLLGIPYSGSITGAIKTVDVIGSIAMDLTSYQFALNSFGIASVESISAKVKGDNSVTDFITNIFVGATISIVQDTVINDINEIMTAAIEDALAEINANLGPSSSS